MYHNSEKAFITIDSLEPCIYTANYQPRLSSQRDQTVLLSTIVWLYAACNMRILLNVFDAINNTEYNKYDLIITMGR